MKKKVSVDRVLTLLKFILKQRKITYRELASKLKLSEITIKRWLNGSDITLSQIEMISEVLDVPIDFLLQEALKTKEMVFLLTKEQELYLVKNPTAFTIFSTLNERKVKFEELQEKFGMNKKQVFSLLRQMDDNGLIELGVNDKIKLLHRGTWNWLNGGPLQKKYLLSDIHEFYKLIISEGNASERMITYSSRKVHPNTLIEMVELLNSVGRDLRIKAQRDESFYEENLLVPCRWAFGLGPDKNIGRQND